MNAISNVNLSGGREIRTPINLIVRCLIEGHADHWEAYTLEFGLAAQAETLNEAKTKIQSMVSTYIFDALVGEDREHAELLLKRRARTAIYLKYYFTKYFRSKSGDDKRDRHDVIFNSALPLGPVGC